MKTITMTGEKTAQFFSPINIDTGYSNDHQGDFKSSLEYFGDNESGSIEWIVEDEKGNDVFVENIGCWFEDKRMVDYDGVFELPIQAVKFLRKLGFVIPKEFIS